MTRLEQAALELLKAALRVKDMVGQGQIVTSDVLDLCTRAEDVLLPLNTSMTCGTVIETRALQVAA